MITLGIDCGTQSMKTIALDVETGQIVACAKQSYGLIAGLPQGNMEQDPALWIQALQNTVKKVVKELGSRRHAIKGIGVSGQQHGFVPLDSEMQVIRPVKLWCDTSTEEECQIIRNNFGGSKAIIKKVGMDMLPGYTAPKILWLKRHEPDHFARLHTILLPHDYLNWYLTGIKCMEFGDASGTALMNPCLRIWEQDIVEFIDSQLLEKLPTLRSSRQPVGMLHPELAKSWNLPKEIVVSAGGGDNMMGAIGTSNVALGCVTASLGTSGTIYAYSDHPVFDLEGDIAGFCDSTDAWLPLVCTMNVTVATEAIRTLFGWSHEQFDIEVQSVPCGADGLLFLPYLQGERTPNLPHGTGVFHGLNTKTMSAAHMARAAMEGVTLGLAYGLKRIQSLGISPTEIRLIGGGSESAVWRQICADIFGCRVVTLAQSEGAAFGAAIQALAAVCKEKTVEQWSMELVKINADETNDPDQQAYSNYQDSLKKLAELTHILSEGGYL